MGVIYVQHWRLRRIDRWTSRSDPHLAAMLAIFTRLSAGEPIPSIEQTGFRPAFRAFRWIGKALTHPRPGWEGSWLGYGTSHVRSHADEKYG